MTVIKTNLLRRVGIHVFFGSLTGLLLLHPLSMFIHDIVEVKTIRIIPFAELFSYKHFIMAGYFTVLGCIIGIFRGLYIHKRAQLYEELKHLTVTDELTSLYNRRYFENQLRIEIERAERYSHKLTLLLIDLNNFKYFNDTYGHGQGDSILKNVANIFQSSVRKPDFVARYGGDEFVIVMPETDKENAQKLVERLHEEITSYRFEHSNGAQEKVSVSIGSATFPNDSNEVSALIDKADQRLYRNKADGKMSVNNMMKGSC
jgi:diguanylate cyclase (GGDEF)-like protein